MMVSIFIKKICWFRVTTLLNTFMERVFPLSLGLIGFSHHQNHRIVNRVYPGSAIVVINVRR